MSMQRYERRAVVVAVALLALTGCSAGPTAPGPVAPSPATTYSLSGSWAGTISAPGATFGQTLLLVQTSDSTFGGAFETTVNGTVTGAGRIVTGIIRSTAVTFIETYTFGTSEPQTLFEGALSHSGATLSSNKEASDWSWSFVRN
jgi:hypothetical protein